MQSKFERIQQILESYWGFNLWKNSPSNPGWLMGSWRTGYTLQGNLRGHFYEHYRSLSEIERSAWMKAAQQACAGRPLSDAEIDAATDEIIRRGEDELLRRGG